MGLEELEANMRKQLFVFSHQEARRRAAEFCMSGPEGWVAEFREPTRSVEQNAAQWPILVAFSRQLRWPVNGQMVYMSPDDWKDVLTAAYKREQVRVALGLDGGMVMLGQRTSKFGKGDFSEWLEFLHATAAMRGVELSQQTAKEYT